MNVVFAEAGPDWEFDSDVPRPTLHPDVSTGFSSTEDSSFCSESVNSACAIRPISPGLVARILRGEYDDRFNYLYIIDVRFDYEYAGGHIRGAINIHTADDINGIFFKATQGRITADMIIVFYCELGSKRSPRMAGVFRTIDRDLSVYPHLRYPRVFVMRGGYREFHAAHPEACRGGYTPMRDPAVASGVVGRESARFRREVDRWVVRRGSVGRGEAKGERGGKRRKQRSTSPAQRA